MVSSHCDWKEADKKGACAVWSHFYQVQEQAKLIDNTLSIWIWTSEMLETFRISIWVVYTYIYNEDEFTLLYVWLNKIKT